jgi:hypothetical protein
MRSMARVLLGFVVQHSRTLVGRQHVLRIRVDNDPRELAAQSDHKHRHGEHNRAGVLQRHSDGGVKQSHRINLRRPSFKQRLVDPGRGCPVESVTEAASARTRDFVSGE